MNHRNKSYDTYLMEHFVTYMSEILSRFPPLNSCELVNIFEEWTGIKVSPCILEQRMKQYIKDSIGPPFFKYVGDRYTIYKPSTESL